MSFFVHRSRFDERTDGFKKKRERKRGDDNHEDRGEESMSRIGPRVQCTRNHGSLSMRLVAFRIIFNRLRLAAWREDHHVENENRSRAERFRVSKARARASFKVQGYTAL